MSRTAVCRATMPPVYLVGGLDAVYAAVEQRDHSRCRGVSMVVVGAAPGKRGIVATLCYPKRGVREWRSGLGSPRRSRGSDFRRASWRACRTLRALSSRQRTSTGSGPESRTIALALVIPVGGRMRPARITNANCGEANCQHAAANRFRWPSRSRRGPTGWLVDRGDRARLHSL